MRFRRWVPLSGVAFVALLVLGLALGGSTPDPEAPAVEVASFYSDNEVRERLASFVLALCIPFLLVFASSLAAVRSPQEPSSRLVWRRMLLGGSIVASAVIGVLVITHLSLADGASGDVAPEALQALNLLDGHFVYAFVPAFGVMMLGAAGCLIGSKHVRGWLAWAALLLGIGLFVPFVGVLALVLSGVWIIFMSVAVFRLDGTATTNA